VYLSDKADLPKVDLEVAISKTEVKTPTSAKEVKVNMVNAPESIGANLKQDIKTQSQVEASANASQLSLSKDLTTEQVADQAKRQLLAQSSLPRYEAPKEHTVTIRKSPLSGRVKQALTYRAEILDTNITQFRRSMFLIYNELTTRKYR